MEKTAIFSLIGAVGSAIAGAFGGWNSAMTTLVIFMAIDYVTGLVCAGVFHSSQKTQDGGLESKASLKGLFRKFAVLLFVLIAARLDLLLEIDYVKNFVIISFCASELISITENAGLMGLPIPAVITKAITLLNARGDADV